MISPLMSAIVLTRQADRQVELTLKIQRSRRMDYVASMEPPSGAAGALKSTSSRNPSAQGPGDAFHVLQWRDITEASSTLSCPSSNNASKHQINPPPLYLSFEMKEGGSGSAPSPISPPIPPCPHYINTRFYHQYYKSTSLLVKQWW